MKHGTPSQANRGPKIRAGQREDVRRPISGNWPAPGSEDTELGVLWDRR